MQAILESAIAFSRHTQRSDPQLMMSAPVQLLQSLLAVNPVSATELVAHQISVQRILEADAEGLAVLGRTAGVPLHSLHLMRKQLLWGQPLELDAGQGRLNCMALRVAVHVVQSHTTANSSPCLCNILCTSWDWHDACCMVSGLAAMLAVQEMLHGAGMLYVQHRLKNLPQFCLLELLTRHHGGALCR